MEKVKLDLAYFWDKSINYIQFKAIATDRVAKRENTTDEEERKLIDYTIINIDRINRNDQLELDDTIVEKLKDISKTINFLVISETWCGDASQSVPILNKISEILPNSEMRIFFRDDDERLINQYLSNGGKSIPIVIILDDNFEEIAHWGSRPQPCMEFLKKYKENPEVYTLKDFSKDVHNFYDNDKGYTISQEIVGLLL